jgi:hypothetical protein
MAAEKKKKERMVSPSPIINNTELRLSTPSLQHTPSSSSSYGLFISSRPFWRSSWRRIPTSSILSLVFLRHQRHLQLSLYARAPLLPSRALLLNQLPQLLQLPLLLSPLLLIRKRSITSRQKSSLFKIVSELWRMRMQLFEKVPRLSLCPPLPLPLQQPLCIRPVILMTGGQRQRHWRGRIWTYEGSSWLARRLILAAHLCPLPHSPDLKPMQHQVHKPLVLMQRIESNDAFLSLRTIRELVFQSP